MRTCSGVIGVAAAILALLASAAHATPYTAPDGTQIDVAPVAHVKTAENTELAVGCLQSATGTCWLRTEREAGLFPVGAAPTISAVMSGPNPMPYWGHNAPGEVCPADHSTCLRIPVGATRTAYFITDGFRDDGARYRRWLTRGRAVLRAEVCDGHDVLNACPRGLPVVATVSLDKSRAEPFPKPYAVGVPNTLSVSSAGVVTFKVRCTPTGHRGACLVGGSAEPIVSGQTGMQKTWTALASTTTIRLARGQVGTLRVRPYGSVTANPKRAAYVRRVWRSARHARFGVGACDVTRHYCTKAGMRDRYGNVELMTSWSAVAAVGHR